MEGPSIRKVMEHGVELFADVAEYIKRVYVPINVEGVEKIRTPASEIDDICQTHGQMASLLDGIFSKYHTKRGDVTHKLLVAIEDELQTAMCKWD